MEQRTCQKWHRKGRKWSSFELHIPIHQAGPAPVPTWKFPPLGKENRVSNQLPQLSAVLHKASPLPQTSWDIWRLKGTRKQGKGYQYGPHGRKDHDPRVCLCRGPSSLCSWGPQQPLEMLWTPVASIPGDPVAECPAGCSAGHSSSFTTEGANSQHGCWSLPGDITPEAPTGLACADSSGQSPSPLHQPELCSQRALGSTWTEFQ